MPNTQSRTMVVDITAKDQTAKGRKSAEKNFARTAKAAKAAFAVVGAVGTAAIIKSTQLFIRQEQAIKQLEIRLKSTGGVAGFTSKELIKMAAGLQKVSVFGDEAVIEMQALLLTFTQIRGEEFKGAQEAILNVATAMGTDLKSAAIQVGKALNDPKVGLTALTRSGITFSDVQKDLIKGFVESGEQAKAQQIILKELETQFGGASQATGLGGAVAQFNNALGDLFETFGEGISEGGKLNETLDTMTQQMQNPAFQEAIKNTGEAVGFMAAAWQSAAESVGAFVGGSSKAEIDAMLASLKTAGVEAPIEFLTLPGRVPTLGGINGGIGGTDRGGQGVPSATAGIFAQQAAIAPFAAFQAPGQGGLAATGEAAANLGAFEETLRSETEVVQDAYTARMEIVTTAEEHKIISAERSAELSFNIEEQKETALTKLSKSSAMKRQQNAMASLRGMGQFADNIFGAMANSAEAGSKKEFKANQNRAIASAVVNTAQGATKAFSQWGWPWGAAAAAAVVAAGAGQISRIKGQTYGGGGSVEGDAPATFSTPTFQDNAQQQPITQPTDNAAQGGPTYNVTVLGNIIDNDQFARDLITPLEKARLDGVEARVA